MVEELFGLRVHLDEQRVVGAALLQLTEGRLPARPLRAGEDPARVVPASTPLLWHSRLARLLVVRDHRLDG